MACLVASNVRQLLLCVIVSTVSDFNQVAQDTDLFLHSPCHRTRPQTCVPPTWHGQALCGREVLPRLLQAARLRRRYVPVFFCPELSTHAYGAYSTSLRCLFSIVTRVCVGAIAKGACFLSASHLYHHIPVLGIGTSVRVGLRTRLILSRMLAPITFSPTHPFLCPFSQRARSHWLISSTAWCTRWPRWTPCSSTTRTSTPPLPTLQTCTTPPSQTWLGMRTLDPSRFFFLSHYVAFQNIPVVGDPHLPIPYM